MRSERKKKMKKIIGFVLLMCLCLAGCGRPAETEQPSADEAKEPVTLKVGLLGNSIKPVGVLVADAIGYFAEEGVAVEFEKVSSMNDAYMAVSTGDLDVYLFSSTAAATFISQGVTTLRVFGDGSGRPSVQDHCLPDARNRTNGAEKLPAGSGLYHRGAR